MSARATTDNTAMNERLIALCGEFKLPTLATELVPRMIKAGFLEALVLIAEIFELEAQDRLERRIDRLRRASRLPPGKTLATMNLARLPRALAEKVRGLMTGAFLDSAINVLCFGLPGTGKTHAACAIGHALVEAGRSVLFVPTYLLVQELLVAKRDLDLPRTLRKLDLFDLIVLDDIGFAAQSPDEAEVLFTLMAERYERRSTLITSNLVFSEWDRIFKNPMATAAAIDRLVHHAVVLDFDVLSYRSEEAQKHSDNYKQGDDNYDNRPE